MSINPMRLSAAMLLSNIALLAGQIGTIPVSPQPTLSRVEDGLVVIWAPIQASRSDAIDIYDLHGTFQVGINILPLVPEATSVTIKDVSARNGKEVVVAAIYAKPGGVASALMTFDFQGKLQSAFALRPSRSAACLALDDNLNIWTLTESAGGEAPSTVPMVVEYDRAGKEMRKLLTRDAFGVHAAINQRSAAHGRANLGYADGAIWFWLPESTDLVTVQTATGEVNRTATGEPKLPAGLAPASLYRISPTLYILKTVHNGVGSLPPGRPLYAWSADTKQWQPTPYPDDCRGGSNVKIIGALNEQPLFLNGQSGGLCSAGLATLAAK